MLCTTNTGWWGGVTVAVALQLHLGQRSAPVTLVDVAGPFEWVLYVQVFNSRACMGRRATKVIRPLNEDMSHVSVRTPDSRFLNCSFWYSHSCRFSSPADLAKQGYYPKDIILSQQYFEVWNLTSPVGRTSWTDAASNIIPLLIFDVDSTLNSCFYCEATVSKWCQDQFNRVLSA